MHEQRFYREPLLMVLGRVGGKASRPDALALMAELLDGVLTSDDRIPMDDRPAEEGWKNRTSWEVKVLKEQGILLPTTTAGRGFWALSDQGLANAAELERNTRKAGVPYDTPTRPVASAAPAPFDVDPDLVDRGRAAHHDTVDALAVWLAANGSVPLLPLPDGPLYDLAWFDGDDLHVAEVKSITDENEERQLRLGLGQVLRYQHLLRKQHDRVVAWLVPERSPTDPGWAELCAALGVRLASPPSF